MWSSSTPCLCLPCPFHVVQFAFLCAVHTIITAKRAFRALYYAFHIHAFIFWRFHTLLAIYQYIYSLYQSVGCLYIRTSLPLSTMSLSRRNLCLFVFVIPTHLSDYFYFVYITIVHYDITALHRAPSRSAHICHVGILLVAILQQDGLEHWHAAGISRRTCALLCTVNR